MLDILKVVHSYVPLVQHTTHEILNIDDTEDEAIVVQQQVHPVLFGGDQMTVERRRNIQNVLSTSDTASARLQGIIPIAEDWHAKMCLYKVQRRVTLYVVNHHIHCGTALHKCVNLLSDVQIWMHRLALCKSVSIHP